jgi:hypothetical protein
MYFGDHVLEPISLIVKLALRLGAGAFAGP